MHSHPFNLKTDKLSGIIIFDTTQHQQFRGIVDAMLITRQMGCNRANYTGIVSNGRKGPIYF